MKTPVVDKFEYQGETFKFARNLAPDEECFKDTVFLVEATSCEQQDLWREFHDKRKVSWEQINPGLFVTVGYINDDPNKPVCISIFWVKIAGHKVLFYDCTSRFCDHTMIDAWFAKYLPLEYDGRTAQVDAMNFHTCYHYLNRLNAMAINR